MNTRTLALASAALIVAAISSPASASLIGTSVTTTISHDGVAGGLVGPSLFSHTYGGLPNVINNALFGSFVVASPTVAVGYDNAMLVDFSLFNYSGFIAPVPATGTITLSGLAENVAPGSVVLMAGASGVGPNIGTNIIGAASTITASWSAASIYTPDATPDAFVIAWNSMAVPAPGALALLGLAGVVGARRRRSAS